MNLRVQCVIDLTDAEQQVMINHAIRYGFLREDPRKRWTERERKAAIRLAVYRLVGELLAKKVYRK